MGAIVVLAAGRTAKAARWTALLVSLVPLALSSYMLYAIMANPAGGYQFREFYSWIPSLGINLIFGLDGLGVSMFWLTALLVTVSIVFAWDEVRRPNLFYSMLLLINVAVLGVFSALDLFVFYIFWEFSLIPMYFLISIWGGPNRRYAAIKFFIYTFVASLVMLVGFMALWFASGGMNGGTFSIEELSSTVMHGLPSWTNSFQVWVFLALFVGFAVKFPVVPVHTWLPDAHVEAPTAGSVILAGVLLKMGSYGLIRIALPIVPEGAQFFAPLMFVIAVLSMIYAAVICLAQRDYKKMVAYSSIGSMGIVLLGIAAAVQTGSSMGLVGAAFMMFAHGFFSPMMFMLCGVLQHNLGTREFAKMGGLAQAMPYTAAFLVFATMAGVGLPGLAAFVAELQVFVGAYEAFGYWVFLPALYLAVSAAYYLWALKRAMFGKFTRKDGVDYSHLYDVHRFEVIALAVMVAGLVVYGFWPKALVDIVAPPLEAIATVFRGVA